MKNASLKFKHVITSVFLIFSISIFASDLPDPEILAKQYLKDLCTLNEQDFTRKYMLTQVDADNLIKDLNKTYASYNDESNEKLSDSLAIRSEVHSLVLESYRSFKEWQHENEIDSSKLKYISCEFEFEKKRKIPYYGMNELKIYFSCDTTNYALSCDDFLYLKTKWVGGDFDDIYKVDNHLNTIYYDDYAYDIADTAAVAVDYEDGEYYEGASVQEVYDVEPLTKKQLKIQKKIDAYNRKIYALYKKQYE
jgi:hypothetical protein